MKKMTTIKKEIDVIDDILCNRCERSCKNNDDDNFYGLIEASFSTGYGSPCLPDGMCYTFSLCEKCLDLLFEDFRIKPEERYNI